MYMPPRGGTRGGKDQFEWEEVKVDKHRENYLGHSVMAPVGRWQKGKDLTWYNKKSAVAGRKEKLKEEIAAVKKAEEEAMAAALGLKPSVQPQASLSRQEIAEACRRKSIEEKEEEGEDRMKGLGYQSRRSALIYSGGESTTTKEGATVFEHDPAEKKDHSRLRIVSTSTQPLTSEPPPTKQARLEAKEEESWVEKEDSHAKRSKEKKKNKEKKAKKRHKKEKRHHRHGSDSEEEKRRHRRKEPHSSKRRRHDTSNESD